MVSAKKRKTHANVMNAIYSNIKRRRAEFRDLISSSFYTHKASNSKSERWIYVDVFPNKQGFTRFQRKLSRDSKAAELKARWETLIVRGSFDSELWIEFKKGMWVSA